MSNSDYKTQIEVISGINEQLQQKIKLQEFKNQQKVEEQEKAIEEFMQYIQQLEQNQENILKENDFLQQQSQERDAIIKDLKQKLFEQNQNNLKKRNSIFTLKETKVDLEQELEKLKELQFVKLEFENLQQKYTHTLQQNQELKNKKSKFENSLNISKNIQIFFRRKKKQLKKFNKISLRQNSFKKKNTVFDVYNDHDDQLESLDINLDLNKSNLMFQDTTSQYSFDQQIDTYRTQLTQSYCSNHIENNRSKVQMNLEDRYNFEQQLYQSETEDQYPSLVQPPKKELKRFYYPKRINDSPKKRGWIGQFFDWVLFLDHVLKLKCILISAISGNIASGKTTLCENLADLLTNGEYMMEDISNPYLEKFYEHMSKNPKGHNPHSFNLQNFFMDSRYQLEQNFPFVNKYMIQDRYIIEQLEIFIKVMYHDELMNKEEFEKLKRKFEENMESFRHPDLIIYLETSTDTNFERIKKRNRKEEVEKISYDYLDKLNVFYNRYFQTIQQKYPQIQVLKINTNNKNADQVFELALKAICNFSSNQILLQ